MSWEQAVRRHFEKLPISFDMLREMVETQMSSPIVEEKTSPLIDKVLEILNFNKDELGISTITQSKTTFTVRFKNAQTRAQNADKLRAKLAQEPKLQTKEIQTQRDSVPITVVQLEGHRGNVRLRYKFELTSKGLPFEHILTFAVTGEVTDKLKKALQLDSGATRQEAEDTLLNDEWVGLLDQAYLSLEKLEATFGPIHAAKAVGGAKGYGNADIVLTLSGGSEVGISIKHTIGTKQNVFIFNKDLGLGTEPDSWIPSGDEPWWMVTRKRIFDQLQNAGYLDESEVYDPGPTDTGPPDWLLQSKPKTKKVSQWSEPNKFYGYTVSNTYTEIRELLVAHLKGLSLDELAELVNEAHLGKCPPAGSRIPTYKLSASRKKIVLEEVPLCSPDKFLIQKEGLTVSDMITQEGAQVRIDVPGMLKLIIRNVKFRTSISAHNLDGLKIKTR